MAYIAKTAFEERVSNSARNGLANITGIFRNGADADEICSAGFLCVKDEQTPNEGYTGLKNSNSWYMKAAGAAIKAGTPIYACNSTNVNRIHDNASGGDYKVGANTLGLAVPAGEPDSYTHIVFDGQHQYRFGIGNASAALSTNKFFTIADGLMAPAAAAPTTNGSLYFKLLHTGIFTEGAYAGMDCIDVEAYAVVV